MKVDGSLDWSYEGAGREKWMNPKYILEVDSTVIVNEVDAEDEKEGGVKNDSQVYDISSWIDGDAIYQNGDFQERNKLWKEE